MRNCDFCEKGIPMGASVCHHCGRPQADAAETRRKWIGVAIAVVLMIAVMVIWQKLIGFTPPRS